MSQTVREPAWWPNLAGKLPPEAQQAHRLTFDVLNQHEEAFRQLKVQVDANTKAAGADSSTVSTAMLSAIRAAVAAAIGNTATAIGGVNNQAGAYTIQDTDFGKAITVNTAAAVALTLNAAVRPTWVAAIENLGAGTVTLTPPSGATVNGAASVGLLTGQSAWVFFDGANWWATTQGSGPITGVPAFTGATTTTSATAGGATALPATPAGYLSVTINGTAAKIPYYLP